MEPWKIPSFILDLSPVGILLLMILLFLFTTFVFFWTAGDQKYSRLPQGSLGLPYIGETLQLITSNAVNFSEKRMARYGNVFKTCIFGSPSIIAITPDFAKYVTTAKVFHALLPGGNLRLLFGGYDSYITWNLRGAEHARVHKMIVSSLSPDVLKHRIAEIEDIARDVLDSLVGKPFLMAEEGRKFVVHVAMLLFLDLDAKDPSATKVAEMARLFERGILSFPINLPGTTLHKALKAKEELHKMVRSFLQRKKRSMEEEGDDVKRKDTMKILLEIENDGKSPTAMAEMFTSILYGSHETTNCTITWVLKNLQDNPEALDAMTAEHDEIRQRKGGGEPLTLTDIKSMKYTLAVIQESLRLASPAPILMRVAEEDVDYQGYHIPKGWGATIFLRCFHLNPDYYTEPLRFDPSRFMEPQRAPKLLTFMPFGYGNRICAGQEFALFEIKVLLYHFTSYEWTRIGKDKGTMVWPFPYPKDKLPLLISGKRASTQIG